MRRAKVAEHSSIRPVAELIDLHRSHAVSDYFRRPRRGQSFLGLLLVLLVLALLTAYAAPKVNLTRYRSDAMARRATLVVAAAARVALYQRVRVVVRVDSAGKRLSTLIDRNGNGRRDAGEPETWTALDADTEIVDPPRSLPGPAASTNLVVFRQSAGAAGDFVLYLTSDSAAPSAWRAVHVGRRSALVTLWRFDGTRWSRGRA